VLGTDVVMAPATRGRPESDLGGFPVPNRRIGDVQVGAIGLGEMPMSIEGRPEESRSIATIHAALDAGVSLIDTADAYHIGAGEVGHGEFLVAEALATYGGETGEVLVATKGGHLRPGDGSWTVNGSPAYLRWACEASLKRLGVEAIGLYQFHRPDPTVPYAESIGALRDLLDAGKIRMAGISNANRAQIRQAHRILDGRLVSVQNQYSPAFRGSEPELALCEELGIAFLPWSPLGGIASARALGSSHDAFGRTARRYGVSPQQVCLAWMLARSPLIIPIPGSSRPETIRDSAAATQLTLAELDIAELDATGRAA
jgi:aryl-alcohol dehydrogenase-like predicted oxidoreductase